VSAAEPGPGLGEQLAALTDALRQVLAAQKPAAAADEPADTTQG
jgi:hypothetical protein